MIEDLNLYKVFYMVATYKNISLAAKMLYISQPSVSKSIKTFRDEEPYIKVQMANLNTLETLTQSS